MGFGSKSKPLQPWRPEFLEKKKTNRIGSKAGDAGGF